MPRTSNEWPETQVRHLGKMSDHPSQSRLNNETRLPWPMGCFAQDQEEVKASSVKKKYLLKNNYLVKLNHPGVRHSNDFFILEKGATLFYRQEQGPFLCQRADVQKHSRESRGPGLRVVYCQRGNARGCFREEWECLESHLNNTECGS